MPFVIHHACVIMTPCEHLIYVLEPESKNLMVEYGG